MHKTIATILAITALALSLPAYAGMIFVDDDLDSEPVPIVTPDGIILS